MSRQKQDPKSDAQLPDDDIEKTEPKQFTRQRAGGSGTAWHAIDADGDAVIRASRQLSFGEACILSDADPSVAAKPGWVAVGSAVNAAGPKPGLLIKGSFGELAVAFDDESHDNTNRLVRLPPGTTTICLDLQGAEASGGRRLRLDQVGQARAYLMLARHWLHKIGSEPDKIIGRARTAGRLLLSGQLSELRRRLARRGGATEAMSTQRPAKLARQRMAPKTVIDGPLRVLLCSHVLERQGAPISLLELAVGLSRHDGILPMVWSFADGPLRADLEAAGVDVVVRASAAHKALTAAAYGEALAADRKFLRGLSPAIVHANTLQTFAAVEAAYCEGIASLWNVRETAAWQTYFNDYAAPVRDRALACFGLADEIVFVAHASREAWSPMLPTDAGVTVIPNGLDHSRLGTAAANDARKQLDIPDSVISVLCVGSLCARKGQKDLLAALSKLPDHVRSQIRIDLVGNIGDRYGSEVEAAVARSDGQLRHFAATSDVARHYAAADIFICTSRAESYPRVILEALTYGLPVLTTLVHGIAEQVRDGESAWTYAPGDSDALAQKLTVLATDGGLRRTLGGAAAAAAARLPSYAAMLDAYVAAYRRASGYMPMSPTALA